MKVLSTLKKIENSIQYKKIYLKIMEKIEYDIDTQVAKILCFVLKIHSTLEAIKVQLIFFYLEKLHKMIIDQTLITRDLE